MNEPKEDKGHAVLEQALKAAVEANSKLAEQITAQRKEIERLRAEVARVDTLETAAFRLLRKFHVETECGQPDHWAECEALSYALGPDRGLGVE